MKPNQSEKGSQLVEFALVLMPALGVLFMILNLAWFIFAKATLQEAAREGVRYAVTGQSDASIQQQVAARSMGFISRAKVGCYVSVQYFAPSNLSTPITGSGSNAGGNVVEVSIGSVPVNPFASVWQTSAITFSATSSDVMEASPNGIPPARGAAQTCP